MFRTSSPCHSFASAQEEVCCHTLAFFLAVAPQAVMIHPNSVDSIVRIRGAAQAMNYAALTALDRIPGARVWIEAYRGAVIEEHPPGRKQPKFHHVAPRSPAEVADKELETIRALTMAWRGDPLSPSNLPRGAFTTLAANIQKGRLKLFLQKYLEHFTVHEGAGKLWTFSVH